MEHDIEVDARGLACPQPVILTKKALRDLSGGAVVALVDNAVAKENILRLAKGLHLEVTVSEQGDGYRMEIRRGSGETAVLADRLTETAQIKGNWILIVTRPGLGGDHAELGSILLRNWLYALGNLEIPPQAIYFFNGGVTLTCKNSPVLEDLLVLAQKGVDIYSCGLCLDFYKLKEDLCIGKITNMYQVAEAVALAPKAVVF